MPPDEPPKKARTNKPPPDDLLAQAAELRAGGATWEAVGAQVRRAAETVRRWPAALHAAERKLAAEAGAEAVLVLRQLLRSGDEGHRRQAAKTLIALGLDLARLDLRAAALAGPKHEFNPGRLLVTLLETQTDEHLVRLVTAEHERAAGEHPGAPGGPPGGPG